MLISIITLFPEAIEAVLNHSMLKKAQESGKVDFKIINLRNFGIGTHKTVDDKPYGGGNGMVLKVDVLYEAIKETKQGIDGERVVLLDPRGRKYTQKVAEELTSLKHLILICGHYEGVDERIRKYVDEEISIGDYILTGGEIASLAIVDSVTRLLPGVLRDEESTNQESFSMGMLEYPQYTRPDVFSDQKVPDVLKSGDHVKIQEFRKREALRITKENRPDLLD